MVLPAFIFDSEPVGYSYMVAHFDLKVIPHFRWSYIGKKKQKVVEDREGLEIHIYPESYAISSGESLLKHVEFAIKHEGYNFPILKLFFQQIDPLLIQEYILASPTGKYSRIIWYLYEELLELKLPIDDAKKGEYFSLLDSKMYYTAHERVSKRHRLKNNMLGSFEFCPFVRKTKALLNYEEKKLDIKAEELLLKYDEKVVSRAMSYLYTKETMSSYEIERERPDRDRSFRFIELLQKASSIEKVDKETLVSLQQVIVDSRFKANDFRGFQNYVGELIDITQAKLHYICPKPEDVNGLMGAFESVVENALESELPAIISAAIVAFAFVFIHPFEDGNGRIHRFLIHYVLSKKRFNPDGVIFPISATILKNHKAYDKALESFSYPLLKCITDYDLKEDGELVVKQESKVYYQYFDYTEICEFLYACVEKTIDTEFKNELEFISCYDQMKKDIQDIVDIPDRLIDLYIKFSYQNEGTISPNKQKRYFSMLTEAELEALKLVAQKHLKK
ncbi:MAG: cell filamentation protein Fic [Chlamydiales bacterium]|nr:cell filamentation protein Fic [Chlamydiales bacterium]